MTPLNFRCYFTTFYLVAVLSIFLVAADCVGAQTRWVPSQVQSGGDLVAVYFTSDKNGWIAGDNGYLASTNDGGATWSAGARGSGSRYSWISIVSLPLGLQP